MASLKCALTHIWSYFFLLPQQLPTAHSRHCSREVQAVLSSTVTNAINTSQYLCQKNTND